MPTGIYIDHGNNHTVDMTQHFGAFVGSFLTSGTETGLITDARLVGRSLYCIAIYVGSLPLTAWGYEQPNISFNAATGAVSWRYDKKGSAATEQRKHEIIYGVW